MAKKIIDDGEDDVVDLSKDDSEGKRGSAFDDDDDEPGSKFRSIPEDDEGVLDESGNFLEESEDAGAVGENEDDPQDGDGEEGRSDADSDGHDDDDPGRPPSDDDDEESAPKKDEQWSKSVRKRIAREQALTAKQRAIAEQERQRRQDLESEVRRLKAKLDSASIDVEVDKIIEEVEDARRDADTRREAIANAKLARAMARKEELERDGPAHDRDGDGGEGRKARDAKVPVHPSYKAWMGRNPWYGKTDTPEARRLTSHAKELAQEIMQNEGLSDTDEALYRRLDAELRKEARALTGRTSAPRTTIARPTDVTTKTSKPTITRAEELQMKKLGLDPKNAEHRKEWLANA